MQGHDCGLHLCDCEAYIILCGLQLTRGIEKTVAALVEELQELSVAVRDEDLANVATVSAGGNEVVSAPVLPVKYGLPSSQAGGRRAFKLCMVPPWGRLSCIPKQRGMSLC